MIDGIRERSQTPHIATETSKRALEPMERISEIWFGLLMVLTFTCSLSVTSAGREEVRTLLVEALGCNLAWGIIDGCMYLVGCFVERGKNIAKLRAVQHASDAGTAYRAIAGSLPPVLASVLSPVEFEVMRQKLNQLPERPQHLTLKAKDWLGAAAVFLAVFLSTFPVVVPFLFIGNARLALRVSNGIALVLLFLTGYAFGLYADHRPWRMGLGTAILGTVLVGIAIALGG